MKTEKKIEGGGGTPNLRKPVFNRFLEWLTLKLGFDNRWFFANPSAISVHIMPHSNAEIERVFSCMNYVKSYFTYLPRLIFFRKLFFLSSKFFFRKAYPKFESQFFHERVGLLVTCMQPWPLPQ